MTVRTWFEVEHVLEVDSQYSFVILRCQNIIESAIGHRHVFTSLRDTNTLTVTIHYNIDKVFR